ncbi:MAG: CHASE2 domain-containing protein [Cyanobacteria bacterium J06634_5]
MAKKKILILAANPKNTSRRRLDEEVRDIDSGVQRALFREQFEVVTKFALRTGDIQRALLDEEPAIVHFSGHGAAANGLIVEDKNGKAKLVSTQALARLFKFFKDDVECVVLNACYSEEQAEAIREHIDYVVGMEGDITNQEAIRFSTGFYDALGAGRSYADAAEMGRIAVDMSQPSLSAVKRKFRIAIATSTVISILMIVARFIALFSPLELIAYDFLMKIAWLEFEPVDNHVVIVGIDDDDFVDWNVSGAPPSVSDLRLLQILETINNANPAVVGLDIFREMAEPSDTPPGNVLPPENSQKPSPQKPSPQKPSTDFMKLRQYLEDETNRVISTCWKVGVKKVANSQPPFKLTEDNQALVGFSDIVGDTQETTVGGRVRRQLFYEENLALSECTVNQSLSYRIAMRYLSSQYDIQEGSSEVVNNKKITLGKNVFHSIFSNRAGYSTINDGGFQVLINFRANSFETSLSASELLKSADTPSQLKDKIEGKIVLVGYTSNNIDSNPDIHDTPIGRMPGAELQAHMIQNIVGPALAQQPSIKAFIPIIDLLLIIFWCYVGGAAVGGIKYSRTLIIAISAAVSVLFVGCFLAFALVGWWLPLVPSTIGLLTVAGSTVAIDIYQSKKEE